VAARALKALGSSTYLVLILAAISQKSQVTCVLIHLVAQKAGTGAFYCPLLRVRSLLKTLHKTLKGNLRTNFRSGVTTSATMVAI
jgi:hypothetical protein